MAWISLSSACSSSARLYTGRTRKLTARLKKIIEMPMGTAAAEELWKERLSFYIAFFEKLLGVLNAYRAFDGLQNEAAFYEQPRIVFILRSDDT